MDGKGKDLLDLFIRAGCREAKEDDIKGEDLGRHLSLHIHKVFFQSGGSKIIHRGPLH